MLGNCPHSLLFAPVPRPHRHTVLNDEPLPTWTPGGVDYGRQVDMMRELRGLANAVAHSYHARDVRLHALALSGSLSRGDMARATGLNKSRVDQIIREMAEQHQRLQSQAGSGRSRRHLMRG